MWEEVDNRGTLEGKGENDEEQEKNIEERKEKNKGKKRAGEEA